MLMISPQVQSQKQEKSYSENTTKPAILFSFHSSIYLVGAAVPEEEELTAVEEFDGEDSEDEDVSAGL